METALLRATTPPRGRAADDAGEPPRSSDSLEAAPAGEGASVATTAFNMLNNLVGSGLLSIPYTFRIAGVPLGVASLVFAASLSFTSFCFVSLLCESDRSMTTFRAMAAAGGVPRQAASWVLLLYTFGTLVSFIILSCDFVAGKGGLAPQDSVLANRWAVCALLFVIICPSALYGNLADLKVVSVASAAFMVAMVAVAGYFVATMDTAEPPNATSQPALFAALRVVPVHIICFSAQINGPRFYAELQRRSPRRFAVASALAVGSALCIYLSFGLLGLRAFPDAPADLIADFPSDGVVGPASRAMMAVVVLTTYPLLLHAMRTAFRELFTTDWPVACIALTCLVGAALPDIGVVLELKGALLGSAVVFGFTSLANVARLRAQPEPLSAFDARVMMVASAMLCLAVVFTLASLTVFVKKHVL